MQLRQILGVEACVWTERISTLSYLEFMLMPRMAALAGMSWTPSERQNFALFDARLQPYLSRYRQLGIHYYDKSDPLRSLREARRPSDVAPKLSLVQP
jgi:hexosaminidase